MNQFRTISSAGLRGFLIAATIVVPVAAQRCKPLVGSFEAQVQPADTCTGPLCTAGNVWGGIQGKYRFTMDKIIPNGEPEVLHWAQHHRIEERRRALWHGHRDP